jgi:hypothetical protein
MTEKVVTDAIAQLDALPSDDAWVEVSSGPDGDIRIAEAREYRSWGPAARELHDLSSLGSECVLAAVELLRERPARAEPRSRIRDKVALLGCGILAFVIAFIFVMGLGVVTGVIPTRRTP